MGRALRAPRPYYSSSVRLNAMHWNYLVAVGIGFNIGWAVRTLVAIRIDKNRYRSEVASRLQDRERTPRD